MMLFVSQKSHGNPLPLTPPLPRGKTSCLILHLCCGDTFRIFCIFPGCYNCFYLYLQSPDNIWPSFIFWHISPRSFCCQIIRIPWQLMYCWKSVVCTHVRCFSQIEIFGNFNMLNKTIENISNHLKLK